MPKFYQTPGGTLSTSEKQWKADMKSEGIEPKDWTGRNSFDVPTKAADLAEFLTFHNVNVVNPQGTTPATEVAGGVSSPPHPDAPSAAPSTTVPKLDDLFEAAPIRHQLDLAVSAIDRANGLIERVVPANPRDA